MDEKKAHAPATSIASVAASNPAAAPPLATPASVPSAGTGAANTNTAAVHPYPRIIELVLSALAQPTSTHTSQSYPQHVLLDFSDLDARAVDSKIGLLRDVIQRVFGVGVEIMRCHPTTMPEDFYRTPAAVPLPTPAPAPTPTPASVTAPPTAGVTASPIPAAGAEGSKSTAAAYNNALQPGAPLTASPQLPTHQLRLSNGSDLKTAQLTATPQPAAAAAAATTSSSSGSRSGPIFSPILIVHNTDVLPASTKSTLLQAMHVHNITIDGTLHDLPRNQMVISTIRNSTQLSRGLMDEYMFGVLADPQFFDVLDEYAKTRPHDQPPIPWTALQSDVSRVFVPDSMNQYVRDIVVCVRQHARVAIGPSVQGGKSFLQAAKMHALLSGVYFVRPIDADAVAVDTLSHRILVRQTGAQSAAASAHSNASAVALNSRTLTHTARLIVHHLVTKVLMPPK